MQQLIAQLMDTLLGRVTGRRISDETRKNPAVRKLDLADRKFDLKDVAIFLYGKHFATDADDPLLARRNIAFEIVIMLVPKRRRHQTFHILADHLASFVAKHHFGRRVEGQDAASIIDRKQCIW